jgi:hypothetical protein
MTVHTTTWSPDTCSCIIQYTWDDSVPDSERTHTVSNVDPCSIHANTGANKEDKWNAVKEENSRKNISFQDILDNGPAALYDLKDGVRTIKQNINVSLNWSGEAPNRVLTVSFPGVSLTTQQRTTIQNFLNNKFGAGRVILG